MDLSFHESIPSLEEYNSRILSSMYFYEIQAMYDNATTVNYQCSIPFPFCSWELICWQQDEDSKSCLVSSRIQLY